MVAAALQLSQIHFVVPFAMLQCQEDFEIVQKLVLLLELLLELLSDIPRLLHQSPHYTSKGHLIPGGYAHSTLRVASVPTLCTLVGRGVLLSPLLQI